LTWEAAADEVDRFEVLLSDFFDTFVSPSVRPVRCEPNVAKVSVLFDLPDGLAEPGPFEAKFEATYPREERADLHGFSNGSQRVHPFPITTLVQHFCCPTMPGPKGHVRTLPHAHSFS
jgi:hypothetical protein